MGSSFILLHMDIQFSQHHLLKRLSFPQCMFLAPLWKWVRCRGVKLFLGSLLCSIGLCVYFYISTMLFWWLWPYNIVWSQVIWCLQICCFCLVLFQLCGLFFCSIWILGLFFQVFWIDGGILMGIALNLYNRLLIAVWPF